ncbi:histone protein [Streptomyces prasinus]|uniref:histone protein n=1 Tax=Streptomyces prasinus TaxID=67345 RepID=UPI0033A04753
MEDQSKAALGAAVIGGYLLGRTGKGRLALTVATYLAGRRFGLAPRQLAAEGVRRLGEVPQFAQLQDQLRGEVLEAGRKAMTATANRSLSSLADSLSDRTARLTKPPREEDEGEGEDVEDEYEEEEGEETPDDEGAEYEDDEYEDEEEPGPEEEEEEEAPERKPEKRPSGRKTPAKKSAPAKKKAAEKKPPAKKATAKKTAAKKTSPAKKAAASASSSVKGTASKRTKRRR